MYSKASSLIFSIWLYPSDNLRSFLRPLKFSFLISLMEQLKPCKATRFGNLSPIFVGKNSSFLLFDEANPSTVPSRAEVIEKWVESMTVLSKKQVFSELCVGQFACVICSHGTPVHDGKKEKINFGIFRSFKSLSFRVCPQAHLWVRQNRTSRWRFEAFRRFLLHPWSLHWCIHSKASERSLIGWVTLMLCRWVFGFYCCLFEMKWK